MLRAAKVLQIPVVVTTQNSAKLGGIVPELQSLVEHAAVNSDKTLFSMLTDDKGMENLLYEMKRKHASDKSSIWKPSVVIVGIESHICVTQTALDLRK